MPTDAVARVVSPDDLDHEETTAGIRRAIVFETPNNVMIHSRVPPDTTTGWHSHGERQTYGYILEAAGTNWVEYGADGDRRMEVEEGEFFTIEPGTVHRDANPTDEPVDVLVCFVGSGPVVVNVDGPGED